MNRRFKDWFGGAVVASIVSALGVLAWGQAGGPFTAPSGQVFLGPSIGEQWAPTTAYFGGINQQTGTTYTIAPSDLGKLVTFNNTNPIAVTLPQCGSSGFPQYSSWFFTNKNTGIATITPTTSNIMGVSSVVLGYGDSIDLVCDGTNYQPEGGLPNSKTCTASGASPQTCNSSRGAVTTGTLTTAALTAAANYVINDTNVVAGSILSCDIATYSGTFGTNGAPIIGSCTPGAGTITVIVYNAHTTNALNGTLTIDFAVLN